MVPRSPERSHPSDIGAISPASADMPCAGWHDASPMDAQSDIEDATVPEPPNMPIAPTRAGNPAREAATTKVKMVRTRCIWQLCIITQYLAALNPRQVTVSCTAHRYATSAINSRASPWRSSDPTKSQARRARASADDRIGEELGLDVGVAHRIGRGALASAICMSWRLPPGCRSNCAMPAAPSMNALRRQLRDKNLPFLPRRPKGWARCLLLAHHVGFPN
jgi:hypothetical protein